MSAKTAIELLRLADGHGLRHCLAVAVLLGLSACGGGGGADVTQAAASVQDTAAPSVPGGLTATAASSSQVNLSWTASTDNVGVSGYRVFRNGTQVATPTATTYSDTGLTASTTYSYTVAAVDAAGNVSAQSAASSATTQAAPDTVAPSVPGNLTATAVSAAQINISWTASTDNVAVTGYRVFRNGTLVATTAGVSYADTGLAASTLYSYTVSAFDAAGNVSALTAARTATTQAASGGDTTAPSVPANLTATAVSSTQVNLSWTASTDNVGVTGYRVYRNGTQVGAPTTATYSDAPLVGATTYTYTVAAVDAAGNMSAQSAPRSVTTLDSTAPSVPANLTATATSSSQIDLAWTASTDNVGVAGYRVYRNGTQVATPTSTAYSDTGLTAATSYSYTVAAVDAAGNVSAQSAARSATTQAAADTTAPSVPANLTATATSSSQINLAWTASTDNVGVTGYRVFRNGAQVGTPSANAYSDTGLTAATSYSYTVRAVDAAGNVSAASTAATATTNAAADTTAPSVPAGLSATAISPTQVNLSWTASTDNVAVTSYRVYRDGVLVGAPNSNAYADSGLVASTLYSYTVAAVDAANNVSAQSSAQTVTTQAVADTTAPSVPTGLTATAASSTQINLSWTASTDNVAVTGYRVFRGATQVGTPASNSYSDTGLTASTLYSYTVRAVDAAANVSGASTSASATTNAASAGTAFPLKRSANGRFLEDQNGKPFFIVGDAPQTLAVSLNSTDTATYLNDRAGRGFNAIWVIAVDRYDQAGEPANANGDLPFTGGVWFTNPNEAYWAHLDSVIQSAAAKGIAVFLNISFIGFSGGRYDYPDVVGSSLGTLTAYGAFIGNRYKNQSNVIYLLGGDSDVAGDSALPSRVAAFASGIRSFDTTNLITFEACRNTCAGASQQNTITAYGGSPPASYGINWVYNNRTSVVDGCQTGYAQSATSLAPMMGEDTYELESNGGITVTGFMARQAGYWAVLSGCYLGRLAGNGVIWHFNSAKRATSPTWQGQLSSDGSVGQQYLGKLMLSRKHWLMTPDISHTVMTSGFGSGETLSVAARSSDGQTIIAYLSDGNSSSKSIDMSRITSTSNTARAWWYNPRSSATSLIGTFPNSGSQSFTAPDGNDWVLVIDDDAASLPAPGSTVL